MEINCSCTAFGYTHRCLDCLGGLKVEAKRGMVVYYVPKHAQRTSIRGYTMPSFVAEGVERGFITSVSEDFVFCRYFEKKRNGFDLRTVANSEATSPEDLWSAPATESSQKEVDKLLEEL